MKISPFVPPELLATSVETVLREAGLLPQTAEDILFGKPCGHPIQGHGVWQMPELFLLLDLTHPFSHLDFNE